MSNHVSYFDISVLGSLIAGSFVAKREVAGWPLFGWVAKLQRSIFIARRGRQAAVNRDEMRARLLLYGSFTAVLLPVQAVAVLLHLPLQKRLPLWYHRHCCWILGLRVECRGQRSTTHPTLFVSNHVSYFDIAALGSLIAGSFVAKREVANWPLFGWLAKLQRSIFIARRGRQAAANRDEMRARLESNDDLILFADKGAGPCRCYPL